MEYPPPKPMLYVVEAHYYDYSDSTYQMVGIFDCKETAEVKAAEYDKYVQETAEVPCPLTELELLAYFEKLSHNSDCLEDCLENQGTHMEPVELTEKEMTYDRWYYQNMTTTEYKGIVVREFELNKFLLPTF